MAKREITIYVDDVDGTESEDGETVLFAVQGVFYEIDLCEANRAKFGKAMAPWVAKARPRKAGLSLAHNTPAPRTGLKSYDKEVERRNRDNVRSWFNALTAADRANIYPKGAGAVAAERGRIADVITTAYAKHEAEAAAAKAQQPKPALSVVKEAAPTGLQLNPVRATKAEAKPATKAAPKRATKAAKAAAEAQFQAATG